MLVRKKEFFNPVILSVMTVLAVFGIVSGVFSAKCSKEAYEIIKEAKLFSDNFNETLKGSFLSEIIWMLLCALGGMNVFLIPLSAGAVFFKGYTYGFTAGCMVASLGKYGYALTLTGLFAQNFLSHILLVFYGTYGINKSIECYLNRRNYEYIHRKNKAYIIVSLISLILVMVISFTEAAVSMAVYEI